MYVYVYVYVCSRVCVRAGVFCLLKHLVIHRCSKRLSTTRSDDNIPSKATRVDSTVRKIYQSNQRKEKK